MRWVRRGLWIAAWGVWAWCGFGLARELPRKTGPVACKLPLGEKEILTDLIDEPSWAVTIAKPSGNQTVVRIWDLNKGTLSREFPGPYSQSNLAKLPIKLFPGHRLLVTRARRNEPMGTEDRYSSIDLDDGRWLDLGITARGYPEMHPQRTWGLFLPPSQSFPHEATIIDLQTGRRLFHWPPQREKDRNRSINAAFFVGADHVAISTWAPGEDGSYSTIVEVWAVGDSKDPTAVWKGISMGMMPVLGQPIGASPTGRVAWHPEAMEPAEFKVFDFLTGRTVFDNCVDRSEMGRSGMYRQPERLLLSANGEMCFSVSQSAECWDLTKNSHRWPPIRSNSDSHIVRFFKDAVFQSMPPLSARCVEQVDGTHAFGCFRVIEDWAIRANEWSARQPPVLYGMHGLVQSCIACLNLKSTSLHPAGM